jgi:hypothetical protein
MNTTKSSHIRMYVWRLKPRVSPEASSEQSSHDVVSGSSSEPAVGIACSLQVTICLSVSACVYESATPRVCTGPTAVLSSIVCLLTMWMGRDKDTKRMPQQMKERTWMVFVCWE